MNDLMVALAQDILLQHLGIEVTATLGKKGESSVLDLAPRDVHPNESFVIRFKPGWRSAEAEFIPGAFAAPLIEKMGEAALDFRTAAQAYFLALIGRKVQVTFRVNGTDLHPSEGLDWPSGWRRFELAAKSPMAVIDENDVAQMRQLMIELVVPVFGVVAALIGAEEFPVSTEGELEGTPFQTLVTRYERKKINREACIQLKGTKCAACGFDFGSAYGPLGAGYIEIHHTTPVSKIGPDYRIDVLRDLEPLCANCHAMVHREDPPVAVPRLAELISAMKQR